MVSPKNPLMSVMTTDYRVSVRDLVAHVLAAGDLEHGFTGRGRLIKAIRAHRKVQGRRPASTHPIFYVRRAWTVA